MGPFFIFQEQIYILPNLNQSDFMKNCFRNPVRLLCGMVRFLPSPIALALLQQRSLIIHRLMVDEAKLFGVDDVLAEVADIGATVL